MSIIVGKFEGFKDEAKLFGEQLKFNANPFSEVYFRKSMQAAVIGIATILATAIVLGLAAGHVGELGNLTTKNIATIAVAGLGVGLTLTYFASKSIYYIPGRTVYNSNSGKYEYEATPLYKTFGKKFVQSIKPIFNKTEQPIKAHPRGRIKRVTLHQSTFGNIVGAVGFAAILATLVFFSLAMAGVNLSGLDKFGNIVTNNTAAFSVVGLVAGFATTYILGKSLLNTKPLSSELSSLQKVSRQPVRALAQTEASADVEDSSDSDDEEDEEVGSGDENVAPNGLNQAQQQAFPAPQANEEIQSPEQLSRLTPTPTPPGSPSASGTSEDEAEEAELPGYE